MSDSSSEEDLSRFREAVDTSFTNFIANSKEKQEKKSKPPSDRHLDTASHYNDVKVPEILQKQIAEKISKIISKGVEFVDIEPRKPKKQEIKGGVKLFMNSIDYLTSEECDDSKIVQLHNEKSRKMYKGKRKLDEYVSDEYEKNKSIVVTGDYILSKDETKWWKSRRKNKIFKYKSCGKSKVLLAIE